MPAKEQNARIGRRRFCQAVAAGAGTLLAARARGARAASAPPLRVGMSSALSGPARGLGLGMKAGIEAYFRHVNEEGGVHGRPLELLALDDGYEPGRAAPNMRRLIDEEKVFAVLGNAGTPTAAVTVPIANEKKVPLFGAFTGSGLLRKSPPDRYVINYRASYAQETAEMVRGLVTELKIAPEKIAFFTQNDAYGDSGFAGGVKALEALGFAGARWLPHGRYPRNTADVEDALSQLIDPRQDPQAVIMVGAYHPCARFIQLAREVGLRALFLNVSFVVAESLSKEAGRAGDGVVVTQVVPHPDAELPATELYRKLVAPADRTFISLEGYLVARAFVEGLKLAGPGATPERFIDALESGAAVDLGLGAAHHLSKTAHQLSDRVWPTFIQNGVLRPLGRWTDLRRTA